MDARYQSSELLANRLVDRSAYEYVFTNMEDYSNISQAGLQWRPVEHSIVKRAFSLPNNCVPVTKSRLNSLELEKHKMKSTICEFNSELEEANNMLA